MQKKIIMAHIVVYALCVAPTNVSYTKLKDKKVKLELEHALTAKRK